MSARTGAGAFSATRLFGLALAAFIVLSMLPSSHAQNGNDWVNNNYAASAVETHPNFDVGSVFAGTDLVKDYKLVAILAAVCVILLSGLAYFLGGALESEQLKSWGRMELAQALSTAVLVAAFLGVLLVMDTLMEESAKNIVSPCGPAGTWDYANAKPIVPPGPAILPAGSPRALQYSVCYLDSIYGKASSQAQSDLKDSLTFFRMAYSSMGMQGTNWYTLWFGIYSRGNAEMRLQAEMSGLQFDMVSKMMISLQAQRFLVGQVAAVLGPVFLIIGIVLRAFVFTRKAGGMLLALSVGLLVILPSAYLLAWSTLTIAVYGNQVIGSPDSGAVPGMPDTCASCRLLVPVAFSKAKQSDPYSGIDAKAYIALQVVDDKGNQIDYTDEAGLEKYGASQKGGAPSDLQSCYPKTDTPNALVKVADSTACPEMCRDLPFPSSKQICSEQACGNIPAACKVIRWISQTHFDGKKTPYCEAWNADGQFGCDAQCTPECKALLPQITAPDAKTQPTVTENSCAACALCPARCRIYDQRTGLATNRNDPGCQQKCQSCYSDTTTFKNCAVGLSMLSSGDGCNSASLCGPATSLKEAIASGASACPLECRIYFDSDPDPSKDKSKYKDPIYTQYCEGQFKSACQTCPHNCEVNATLAGAVDAADQRASLFKPASDACAAAPTYDGSGKREQGECGYCPMACRFINPSPMDVAADPFLPHANFNVSCMYERAPIGMSNQITRQQCSALQMAQGYDTSMAYSDYYKFTGLDGADRCGPNATVYRLSSTGNSQFCPKYYADNMVPDANLPLYKSVVAAEQYAAPECETPEVISACSDANCGQQCKSDWPVFCTLANPNDKYSRIFENEAKCQQCKTLNKNQNTTGPQCQALLQYGKLPAQTPALCDAACTASNTCGQSCFPTLALPTSAGCGEYKLEPNPTKDESYWGNCAACPFDCRYDYALSPPQGLSDRCGINLLANLADRKFDPITQKADLNQKYWVCANRSSFSYCEWETAGRTVEDSPFLPYHLQGCLDNGYTCQKVATTDKFWQCVVYDNNGKYYTDHPCSGSFLLDNAHKADPNCANGAHANDWYKDATACPTTWGKNNVAVTVDCGFGIRQAGAMHDDGTCGDPWLFGAMDFYKCSGTSFTDPYPGLNQFLNNSIGVTVCGNLDFDQTFNKDFNFCGNATYGAKTAVSCDLRVQPAGCSVEYDARTMNCRGVNWNQQTPPDTTGCQWCPASCRMVSQPDGNYANCGQQAGIQQDAPVCDSTSCKDNCRAIVADTKPPANLTIDATVCKAPVSGVGDKCPARCRTYLEGWTGTSEWQAYCTQNGYECPDEISQCAVPIPQKACEACARCETDCLAMPYVRQNCDEACGSNNDVLSFNPSQMIGTWSDGVDAWPAHRTIGSLGIAAVVLPLFALLVTFAFVRILSPFLGGDVEIPGLMRFI